MTESGSNKRKYKRVEDIFAITYKLRDAIDVAITTGGEEFNGTAVDISEGGLGVEVEQKLPVGAVIHLNFTITNTMAASELKKKQRTFDLDGQIRHCAPTKKKTFHAGIMFSNITADEARFIQDFVRVQISLKDPAP